MKIILASKSGVRKKILDDNNIESEVVHSNVDEDLAKESLQESGADPLSISKNLAELKSTKVSSRLVNELVLGADSVISINNELINKPKDRVDALKILKKLNGKKHQLISSVCFSKNGSMIWNYTDTSNLKMKNLQEKELENYLSKIETDTLLAYGVYQIESGGLDLFESVEGDRASIMGLPVKHIINYIRLFKNEQEKL